MKGSPVRVRASASLFARATPHSAGWCRGRSCGARRRRRWAPTDTPSSPAPPFDGQYAYPLTKLQLVAGPRPAGSATQRAVAVRLVKLLPRGHFEPVPGGLRNIVGAARACCRRSCSSRTTTPPSSGLPRREQQRPGVGAVIAIAKALKSDPTARAGRRPLPAHRRRGGARRGFSDFYAEGVRGSKAYAAAHARELREVIVLDFIALHDLRLVRDRTSDEHLWSRLRIAAVRARTSSLFPAGEQGAVIDDHTPFLEAGLPAIDLIDFHYRCWQKLCDDLSQVSQANLQRVGSTVLELIRSDRLRRIR